MDLRLDMHVERWAIGELIPRVSNPRTHSDEQVAQIAASIQQFGWTNPILVGPDHVIIAGHGRLLAARKLHMTEVPVIVLSGLTEAQRRALVIADNQLALNAGWSDELLRVELAALQQEDFDLNLIGFDDVELARLLAAQDAAEGLTDADAVPGLPQVPVSMTGNLWILGDHKLVVGDATKLADVTSLVGLETVDLVFSDLPYNVSYEGYTEDHLTIEGDRMSESDFKQFLERAFRSHRTAVKRGASLYICHSSSWQREFQNALESAGFEVRCQIIWAKNTFAWGFGRYKFQQRAYVLLPRRGGEGSLVWGQIAIDALGREKTFCKSIAPNHEAGGTNRASSIEQQQGGRHCRGLFRRRGLNPHRMRASRPEGSPYGDRL
jgi:hypothetical protein